ncbi:MAG: 60S ribosomal export protein NMD3 [Candidatus Aenigmatarchaeota archaeon]
MICVECGAEAEELRDGLCPECYVEKHADVDVEDPIEIDICSKCGSVRKGKKWIERPDLQSVMLDRIEDALTLSPSVDRFSYQVEFDEGDPRNIKADITVEMLIDDLKREKNLSTNMILKKDQCLNCSRREGNYYEAILQVRPSDKEMSEEQKESVITTVHKRIESDRVDKRDVFITAEKEIHGGLDFYLSDRKVSKDLSLDIADDFGGVVTTSSELAGREDGQNVYRMTYSVRLPPYEEGDFIGFNGELYRVKNVRSGSRPVTVQDLKKDKLTTLDKKKMEEAKVYGGEELIKKAVVVSEKEKELQVLDPETYETETLLKPEGYRRGRKEVEVIKVKGRLIMIPKED